MAENGSNNNQNPHEGKVFDTEGFKKALEESGYTIDDAYSYWRAHSDVVAKMQDKANKELFTQLPKVSIKNNQIVISAPDNILKSPITKQIQTELKSLSGANLQDETVARAIDALNKEIETTYSKVLNDTIAQQLGWTEQQLKDYNHLIQVASKTNPTTSTDPIKGYEKDSKKAVTKTFKDWIEYYRSAYSTDERTDALYKSAQSNDPYARTMYLVMTQGGDSAVYGFDEGERIGQGVSAFANQMGQFPEGLLRTLAENASIKRAESFAKNSQIPVDVMRRFNINTEEEFEKKKKSLEGKSWNQLNEEDKAFIILLGASREDRLEKNADTTEEMKNYNRPKTNTYAWDTNAQDYSRANSTAKRKIATKDLNEAVSPEKNDSSRNAITRILADSSFKEYQTTRNDFDTWQGYEDWTQEAEKKLAKTAMWSGNEQGVGNFFGVLGRFLWEDAVFRGLTGGISPKSLFNPKLMSNATVRGLSMNKISDLIAGSAETGKGIIGGLAAKGINPTSKLGQGILGFFARLIGTVPEDILQTTVDNVFTYNADENKNLLNPEELSESIKNNFIWMAAFNAAGAGLSTIKKYRMLKAMEKAANLKKPINIEGILADTDDAARAANEGDKISTENGKTVIIDDNGVKKVLNNSTEEQGNLVQRSLFNMNDNNLVENEVGVEGEAKAPRKGRVIVEAETPDGVTKVEIPDYKPKGMDDAIHMEIEASEPSVKSWHIKAKRLFMRRLNKLVNTMHDKFGDVTVDDFDWVRYNVEKLKKTPEEIIGTVDPTTGRKITKKKIAAMEWWGEQPEVKKLREASEKSFGKEEDRNLLGYLPHSEYNPMNDSFDEGLNGRAGVLWEHSTSAAVLDESGNYKGYGGTFKSRYETFVDNMLWDAKRDIILQARLIEESKMEGGDLTQEQAAEVLKGAKKINEGPANAESTKELEKALSSGSDAEQIDYKALDKKVEEDAKKSDMGKAYHDVYAPLYPNANTGSVVSGRKTKRGIMRGLSALGRGFSTLGNNLKKIEIEYQPGKNKRKIRVNAYDAGGADFINAKGDGLEIYRRVERQGSGAKGIRSALSEYYVNHGTNEKYVDYKVNKVMAKLADAESKGLLTEAEAIRIIGNALKWDAWSRLRKFLVIARYDDFSESSKKTLNNLMFSSQQTEVLTRSQKITKALGNGLSHAVSFRYKALMYGNVKNALLQLSELNRLYVVFKWGDVNTMIKKMATDSAFRKRVADYAEAIAPSNAHLKGDLFQAYSDAADTMEVTDNGVTFKDRLKNKTQTIDNIALAPIESAEKMKNHIMIAALVQEADRKGLTGDAAVRHIRRRFERVALASGKMGQLGYASNPIGRAFLFLQNFQIRELQMHWYNILDEWGLEKTFPKSLLNSVKYITKVLGTKTATLLLLARLGYSAQQIYGLDPFGLLGNDYRGLDDDQKGVFDYVFDSPLFSGGMLSLLSDIYFMSRRAYEDANPRTPSEEAEGEITGGVSLGIDRLGPVSFDQLMGIATGFIPGSTAANRIGQMNELIDTGWATSSTGNKMYSAPEDPTDIALGYLFGRSATQNALQYNQNYGDNPIQTLGRWFRNAFNTDEEFDPIDDRNYTDWFKGNENDLQQFNKGLRYFTKRRDEIIKAFEEVVRKSFDSNAEKEKTINDMYGDLNELFEQAQRFVKAYEDKNGAIDSNMVKQLVNLFNLYEFNIFASGDDRKASWRKEQENAIERYSSFGLPNLGYYTVSKDEVNNPNKDASYYGSPQYQSAVSGVQDREKEFAQVLAEADKEFLSGIRAGLKDSYNTAMTIAKTTGNWEPLREIQYEYLKSFDEVVAPIVAMYGADILSKDEVVQQIRQMLSTGSDTKSANLIPSEQYAKNKWGRYQSMPTQSVDPGKWVKQRFSSDIYQHPTVRNDSTTAEDIAEIKKLDSEGRKGRARAKALQLRVRLDQQRRFVSREDWDWLNKYLSEGSI